MEIQKKIKELLKTLNNRSSLFLVGVIIFVALIVYLDFNLRFTPKIQSSLPENNQIGVNLRGSIKLNFKRKVPEDERENLIFVINPEVPFTVDWVDERTVSINPEELLYADTPYKVKIMYKGEIKDEIVFRTLDTKEYSSEEINKIKDYAFETAKAFYDINERKPYVFKMPLEGENYKVYYNFGSEKFAIILKHSEDADIQLLEEALDEAVEALKNIDVEVTEDDYVLEYKP